MATDPRPGNKTEDHTEEIVALARILKDTQQRLAELSGGHLDAVIYDGGQSFLLQDAQEKLRQSEERFRSMFNAAAVGIAYSTPYGRYLEANQAYCQMLGYSLEELQTRDFASLTHPDDLDINLRVRDQLLAGHIQSFVMEKRYLRKDGNIIWARHSVSATHGANGEIVNLIVVAEDITERKLTEKRADEQTQLYKLASSVGRLGAWAVEYPGPRVVWSEEVRRLHEVEAGFEPDLDTALDFFPPASRIKLTDAIFSGRPYDLDLELLTAKGNKLWVRVTSAIESKDGAVVRLYGVVQDITQRKRAEFRMRRLIDSNVQGVFFWNTKGEITDANDAFLNILQYTREDIDGGRIKWSEATPPEYAELDRRAIDDCIAKGVGPTYEKQFLCKDGSRVSVLIGGATFEDNSNEGVCFVHDLTERKKLEQQFLRAQRMESIGTLAGGVAHDLNNVLAPIIMSIQLLKIKSKDPQADKVLETIETAAKRGADIVRQVLSFARGVDGQRVEVQPKHLLTDLQRIIKDTFPKNIQLRFFAPTDTWPILGDATQVHQVLLNLCLNGRDAMPGGGNLTIEVENCELDEHYVAMDAKVKPGRYVRITVADSGTGIPPDIIDRIFEPFFTTKGPHSGTGLGLSSVMAIVKSHGGIVNVYSEPGKGTTFKVYLPAAELTAGAREQQSERVNIPRGNGETVLVIDDEDSILSITRQTLEAFGYRVLTAGDGAEGVAIYAERKNEIAVVLTDMMMPVMDGKNLIRVLTRMNPAIKIVAASGLASNGSGGKTPDTSTKHFLTKPYTAEILLKTIRTTLDED